MKPDELRQKIATMMKERALAAAAGHSSLAK